MPSGLRGAGVQAAEARLAGQRVAFSDAAGAAPRRVLPYPFTRFLTVASDCDAPDMDGLLATSALLRETLALPVSDSCFPAWLYERGLVQAFDAEGRLIDEHCCPRRFAARNFEWLRIFHFGATDTVHGWLRRLRIDIAPDAVVGWPLPCVSLWNLVCRVLPAYPRGKLSSLLAKKLPGRRRFRFTTPESWHRREPPRYLFFSARLPLKDSRFEIRFWRGRECVARIAPDELDLCLVGTTDYIIDLWPLMGPLPGDIHDLEVEVVLFGAPHVRMDVSRPTLLSAMRSDIERQKLFLSRFNVSASAYTSHGGGYDVGRVRSPDPLAADSRILAESPENPQYALDLLGEFGIAFFNTAHNISERRVRPIEDLLRPLQLNDGRVVYDFYKFMSPDVPPAEGAGGDANPSYSEYLGSQIEAALAASEEDGEGAVIYTHNLVKSRDNPRFRQYAPGDLFNESTRAALRELSSRFLGIGAHAAEAQRVWVPPLAVALRYAQVAREVDHHATLDADGNRVRIRPWRDPIAALCWDDPENPARALRGLTFYVRDAHTARVLIDERDCPYLQRNPADATGRESVTIADVAHGTVVLGRVPRRVGDPDVEARGLAVDHDGVLHTMTLEADVGEFVLKTPRLRLAHHQFLAVSVRKRTPDVSLTLRLHCEHRTLGVSEEPAHAAEHALLPTGAWISDEPRVLVFPLHRLLQAQGSTADPPVEPVDACTLRLCGAPGDAVEVRWVRLVTECDRVPSTRLLLGGRLGPSTPARFVELSTSRGRHRTLPLEGGSHYLFEALVPRGEAVTVHALLPGGERKAPAGGAALELISDRLDVDFP